jgi:hypothetical protein
MRLQQFNSMYLKELLMTSHTDTHTDTPFIPAVSIHVDTPLIPPPIHGDTLHLDTHSDVHTDVSHADLHDDQHEDVVIDLSHGEIPPPSHYVDNHGDTPEVAHGDSHIDTGFSHTDT